MPAARPAWRAATTIRADYLDEATRWREMAQRCAPSPPSSRTCRPARCARWPPRARWRPRPRRAICQDRIREKRTSRPAACPAHPYAVIDAPGRAGRRCPTPAARHPEDRAPGLRRQGPGAGGRPRRTGRRLGRAAAACPACWRSAAAGAECQRHRGARRDGAGGAPAGAAQPAPRRHPGRHRGAGARTCPKSPCRRAGAAAAR
jgi:hypothetical protein